MALINITVTVYLAIKTTANLIRTHFSIQISLIYDLFITLAVLAQRQSLILWATAFDLKVTTQVAHVGQTI